MNISSQFTFLPIIAGNYNSNTVAKHYLPEILHLFERHKNVLLDDYYSSDFYERLKEILELINAVSPHFYVILCEEEFMGFVYLENWIGSTQKLHSCCASVCVAKEFRGAKALEAGKIFIRELFKVHNLHKIKAETFAHNHLGANFLKKLGFSKEATLKHETLKNGKYIDIYVYTIFNLGDNNE